LSHPTTNSLSLQTSSGLPFRQLLPFLGGDSTDSALHQKKNDLPSPFVPGMDGRLPKVIKVAGSPSSDSDSRVSGSFYFMTFKLTDIKK
jgi:hypothetical protein